MVGAVGFPTGDGSGRELGSLLRLSLQMILSASERLSQLMDVTSSLALVLLYGLLQIQLQSLLSLPQSELFPA